MKKISYLFRILSLFFLGTPLFSDPTASVVQDMSFGVLFQGETKRLSLPASCRDKFLDETGIISFTSLASSMAATINITFPASLKDDRGNNLYLIGPTSAFCQNNNSPLLNISGPTSVTLVKNSNNTFKNRVYTISSVSVSSVQSSGDYYGVVTIELLY